MAVTLGGYAHLTHERVGPSDREKVLLARHDLTADEATEREAWADPPVHEKVVEEPTVWLNPYS
jgi:hypothetical protein